MLIATLRAMRDRLWPVPRGPLPYDLARALARLEGLVPSLDRAALAPRSLAVSESLVRSDLAAMLAELPPLERRPPLN